MIDFATDLASKGSQAMSCVVPRSCVLLYRLESSLDVALIYRPEGAHPKGLVQKDKPISGQDFEQHSELRQSDGEIWNKFSTAAR